MDLNEFKAKYSDVYKAAIKSERNRVSALLKAGKDCGKMDYAVEQIAAGTRIGDDLVQAEFLMARVNKADSDNRAGDDPPGVKTPPDAADKFDEEKFTEDFLKKRKETRGV